MLKIVLRISIEIKGWLCVFGGVVKGFMLMQVNWFGFIDSKTCVQQCDVGFFADNTTGKC